MPHMVTFSLLMFALECGLGGIIAVFAPINGDSVTKMVAVSFLVLKLATL